MPPAQARHDLPLPHVPSVVALCPAGIETVGLALLVVLLVGVDPGVLLVVLFGAPLQIPKAG